MNEWYRAGDPSRGRPDEQRAGRAILKDFINGKLLFCVGPEGYTGKLGVDGGGGAIGEGDGIGDTMELVDEDGIFNAGGSLGPSGNAGEFGNAGRNVASGGGGGGGAGGGAEGSGSGAAAGGAGGGGIGGAAAEELAGLAPDDPLAAQLLEEMMNELGGLDGKGKPKTEKQKRAEHKFQKKGAKLKGRIKNAGVGEDHTAGGNGFKMGKRGGMMPASVQATIRSAVTDEC